MNIKEKKNRIITLRISEKDFDVIEEYAISNGLSINAFVNSILKSQAEWFIPNRTYENVVVPKKLLAALFNITDKKEIDLLVSEWTVEIKNSIQLLDGHTGVISMDSLIRFYNHAVKYILGSKMRIKTDPEDQSKVHILIRHDLGDNFSYFFLRVC